MKFIQKLKIPLWKSKIGNTTVVIPFFRRKVKLFQAANHIHAKFIVRTIMNPDFAEYFHPLVFSFDKFILSEWVEGKNCVSVSDEDKIHVIDWVAKVHTHFHQILVSEDDDNVIDYCYMDYLISRFNQYAPPGIDKDKINTLINTASSRPVLKPSLSHPDLTLRNIICMSDTGKFKIVDNELLNQSTHFLLDIFNTCYDLRHSPELRSYYLERYSSYQKGFTLLNGWENTLNAAWAIRIAGSLFQQGMIQEGIDRIEEWSKGNEEIIEMIRSKQSIIVLEESPQESNI